MGPYVKKPGYGGQRGGLGAALGGALRVPSLVGTQGGEGLRTGILGVDPERTPVLPYHVCIFAQPIHHPDQLS